MIDKKINDITPEVRIDIIPHSGNQSSIGN
jgi:hypothetical protein